MDYIVDCQAIYCRITIVLSELSTVDPELIQTRYTRRGLHTLVTGELTPRPWLREDWRTGTVPSPSTSGLCERAKNMTNGPCCQPMDSEGDYA